MLQASKELAVVATALALLAAPVAASGEDGPEFDFVGTAQAGLDYYGVSESSTLLDVVDGPSHLRIDVGSFDLRFPVESAAVPAHVELFQEAVLTLIDLQQSWFDWRAGAADTKEIDADWKTLRKWVKGWSAGKFRKVAGGSASLYDQLEAKEGLREAHARLREHTRTPKEAAEIVGDFNLILIEPTREQFVRMVSVAGLLDPTQREHLWNDMVLKQTASWSGWTQLACLEGVSFPFDLRNPYVSATMNEQGPSGFQQYISERGAVAMLRKQFHRHGTHFLEESMGTNLVVAAAGRNDLRQGEWKLEYRQAGGSTQPYERFVPGGNPAGGTLPARKASAGARTGSALEVSKYREGGGSDFFVSALKDGQKAGAKLAKKNKESPFSKNKTANFALYSYEANGSAFVSAPFLGLPAEGKTLPPNEYLDDYEDFFRAYRACFLYWLQARGADDEDDSRAKFGELIAKHAAREVGAPMDAIVEEVYGLPLSSADPGTDSLEWRFLTWLPKGK